MGGKAGISQKILPPPYLGKKEHKNLKNSYVMIIQEEKFKNFDILVEKKKNIIVTV